MLLIPSLLLLRPATYLKFYFNTFALNMNVQSQFSGAVNVLLLWGSQQFQQHICKQLLMFTLSSAAQLWCKSLAQTHYSHMWQITVLDTSREAQDFAL